jgi:hypothetical protein
MRNGNLVFQVVGSPPPSPPYRSNSATIEVNKHCALFCLVTFRVCREGNHGYIFNIGVPLIQIRWCPKRNMAVGFMGHSGTVPGISVLKTFAFFFRTA